jgi:hypothetical protein
MPSAEAVSHRQQAMRIAINTGVSLWSVRSAIAGGLYSVSVFQRAGFTLSRRAIAGIWLAICARKKAVASTFQRGRWQCVD